jgi:hypothetical protein
VLIMSELFVYFVYPSKMDVCSSLAFTPIVTQFNISSYQMSMPLWSFKLNRITQFADACRLNASRTQFDFGRGAATGIKPCLRSSRKNTINCKNWYILSNCRKRPDRRLLLRLWPLTNK